MRQVGYSPLGTPMPSRRIFIRDDAAFAHGYRSRDVLELVTLLGVKVVLGDSNHRSSSREEDAFASRLQDRIKPKRRLGNFISLFLIKLNRVPFTGPISF